MKAIITSILVLSTFFTTYAGGPWTPKKNHADFILTVSPVIYKSMSSIDGSGISLTRRVIDINSQLYIEYGITNSLAVIGNLNFKSVRTSSKTFPTSDFLTVLPSDRVFGLGNSGIGLKYNFVDKKVLFSLSYTTEFPYVGDNVAAGIRTGYDTYSFVPGVHFGQGFEKSVYYFVEAFFAARNNISHEWRLNTEVGYTFKKPITLALKVNLKQSLKNKTVIESPNYRYTGLYLNDEEFVAWSFNTIYKINSEWSFMAALAGGFKTKLIARTPVISAGVIWKFIPEGY